MFYENYLNSLKPDTSYIPESASISDKAIFVDRALQDIYNEAFFSLASQEMALFEAAIHEADEEGAVNDATPEKKKGLLEIVKTAVSNIWKKIKGFFFDRVTEIKKKIADHKKEHESKIKSDFMKAVKALPADYTVKNIYDIKWSNGILLNISNAITGASALATKAYNQASSLSAEEWDKVYNSEAVDKKLFGQDATEFKVEKAKKVDMTASDIDSNSKAIIDIVFGYKTLLDRINKAYKSAKEAVDNALKSAKEAMGKGKEYKELNSTCKRIISFCKEISSKITKFVSRYITFYRAFRGSYNALVAKVIAKGNKAAGKSDKKEEESKEAAPVGESYTGMDEVEEAFAFLEGDDEEVEVDVKDEAPADAEVEDIESDDDEDIKESALCEALIAYLDI